MEKQTLDNKTINQEDTKQQQELLRQQQIRKNILRNQHLRHTNLYIKNESQRLISSNLTKATVNTGNTLVYVGMSFSKYFSTLLKTTSGRDKFLATLQYSAQFYHSCAKHSSLESVREEFLQGNIQSVRIARQFEDSLSQARKTFRLLKFVDDTKAMADALKTKKAWLFKLVSWVEAFLSFSYYLSDNLLWVFSLLIKAKIKKHKQQKKWKNMKNNFSFSRIVVSVFKLLWHINIRNKKIKVLEQKIKECEEKRPEKSDQAYILMQKYIKIRRKKRFDYLKLAINVQRFFMLYKSLHYPGYKHLDPIFVSGCGLAQAAFNLIKTIFEKRIFVQIESSKNRLPPQQDNNPFIQAASEQKKMTLESKHSSVSEFQQHRQSLSVIPINQLGEGLHSANSPVNKKKHKEEIKKFENEFKEINYTEQQKEQIQQCLMHNQVNTCENLSKNDIADKKQQDDSQSSTSSQISHSEQKQSQQENGQKLQLDKRTSMEVKTEINQDQQNDQQQQQ